MYLVDLGRSPVYLGGDENHFAVIGHSLAETGRNLKGELLPVFVNLDDPLSGEQEVWGGTYYQPLLFYLVAIVLQVLPLGEAAVRLPVAVIAGLITPWLTFIVARRVIGGGPTPLVAAVTLALAPVNVILGRQALDYLFPLPFVVAWLWALHACMQCGDVRLAAALGAVLGVGCYSYLASWLMMPLYLVLSWLVFLQGPAAARAVAWSAAGFAAAMLPVLFWVPFHPEMLRDTVARYGNEREVAGFVPTYISLFDPVLLFARGGMTVTASTARTGAFLVAAGVLFAVGLVTMWSNRRARWVPWLLLAGLLSGPIPASIKGETEKIERALYLLPFVTLIGGFGFAWLWASPRRSVRIATVLLLVTAPIQFAEFYYDFSTHYKLRSAFHYDSIAIEGVARRLIEDPSAPRFYFTNALDDACVKWRFQATKAGRTDLFARTTFLKRAEYPDAPPGSLLVTYVDAPSLAPFLERGWAVETIVHDVDNRPAAAILRRGT